MNWADYLPKIFEMCVFPLLGILTAFLIQFIRVKMKQLSEKMDNDQYNKYIFMLTDTITSCVVAVNQTYVDSLKKQSRFDADAQKEAFRRVYEQVLEIIKGDAYNYLNNIYSDLNGYITALIEQQVREYKIEKPVIEDTMNNPDDEAVG